MTNQPTAPKQPNKRGRQTALTPELQAKIIQVLEAGNYIEAACDYVGISYNTFAEWVRRGESTDNRVATELYANFANAIKKARSSAEISSVARIRKAGTEGQWQADAWFLERSLPDRWGRQRQDVHLVVDPYSKAIADLRKEREQQE